MTRQRRGQRQPPWRDISYYEVRAGDAGQNYNALEGENALAASSPVRHIITVEWSDYADGQIIGQDNPIIRFIIPSNGKTIAFGGIIDNDDIEGNH